MLSSVFHPKHDVQYSAVCQLSYLKRCLSYDKIYTPVRNKAVTVSTLHGGHLCRPKMFYRGCISVPSC